MSSILSTVQKGLLQSVMTDVHDTFKRSLKVIKEGKITTISSNPSYSHIYRQPASINSATKTAVERTIEVRIFYIKGDKEKAYVTPGKEGDVSFSQNDVFVRLKMIQSDFDFIKDSERVILDGNTFVISSSEMPHGLFGNGFYTIYLKRSI